MAIDVVTEEIATNLEEAAAVTRKISSQGVGVFLGGVAVGVAVGFYFGRRWSREKLRAEAFKESQAEVEKIRELYRESAVVVESKPSLEEVVEERGYMAQKTVEDIKKPGKKSDRKKSSRPTKPPVVVQEPRASRAEEPPALIIDGAWDYEKELLARTPEEPYVIHQNEYKHAESGYPQVTYTYYATDDVLVGEDERPIPHGDLVVGQNNLKWGHGTDDIDVVYVRNDKLELEMEICRVYQSYEETVLGLQNDQEN